MPGYVNIGAWVGPRTMVDTWATVGSCAQIGADVHLAGGVGIGGVLEPPNATPVIVEDGAFLGSRCIVTEGVRIGAGAVLSANVSLTASVPIIDVTGDEPVEHRGAVPPRAVVVPGTRPKEFPAGTYQLDCALIIGWRKESHDERLSLNETLREFELPSDGTTPRRSPAEQISSAGPTSVIRASSSSSTRSSPPGMRTVTGLSHQPFATAAAAAATALEPDALVSPAPRSQTSTVSSFGPSTRRAGRSSARGTLVALDLRAEPEQIVATRGEPDDRVRVAHRHRGQLDPLTAELDRLGLPHFDVADAHRDGAVVADRRGIGAAGDADRHLRRPGARAQPGGGDPAAVARELGDGAVGVPDHDLRLGAARPTTSTTPSEPMP